MWLDPDCWDKQFLLYSLQQIIDNLEDILQLLYNLLNDLFQGLGPSFTKGSKYCSRRKRKRRLYVEI